MHIGDNIEETQPRNTWQKNTKCVAKLQSNQINYLNISIKYIISRLLRTREKSFTCSVEKRGQQFPPPPKHVGGSKFAIIFINNYKTSCSTKLLHYMPLKKIIAMLSGRTRTKSERLVRAAYFGLLHRLPEPTNLDSLASKLVEGMDYSDLLESILKSPEFMRTVPPRELNDFLATIEPEPKKEEIKSFKFRGDIKNFYPRNLIYFAPAIAWPLGGVKVLVKHSEIINTDNLGGFSSEIFFPEDHNFNLDWFNHNAKTKRDINFNVEEDIIIIPEVWALKYGSELVKKDIKYAIFVQNGYYIFDEIYKGDLPSLLNLKRIYQGAVFILSVSDDTTNCIQEAFQITDDRIFKVIPSVNSLFFKYQQDKKKNIITYMPRKLSRHSNWLINQITLKDNSGWEILPIDGQNEETVANFLRASKIFLSFSDREGFSLPPLEASFCGNSVIGYTGEGAKEYWDDVLFNEIDSGNLRKFLSEILKEMDRLQSQEFLDIDYEKKDQALTSLRNKYSSQHENNRLAETLTLIRKSLLLSNDLSIIS